MNCVPYLRLLSAQQQTESTSPTLKNRVQSLDVADGLGDTFEEETQEDMMTLHNVDDVNYFEKDGTMDMKDSYYFEEEPLSNDDSQGKLIN